MALSLSNSGGGNSKGYMGNGIYVDEVEIKKASDVTEQEKSSGFDRDVSIKLEVLVLKNDWERTVTIGGNYKRDPITKEVLDWGGAFKLKDLFVACGMTDEDVQEGLSANGIPSSDLLAGCIGKKIKTLTYTNINTTSDKLKYSTWNSVTSAGRDSANFAEYFMSQVAKGYPKNYKAPNSEAQPVKESIAKAVSSVSTEAL
jgi:hypothetical protein